MSPGGLRIALLGLSHPFRGGIAHYTTLLCRALRMRFGVDFYTLSRQYPELLFPGRSQLDASCLALTEPHRACIDSLDPRTWLATGLRIRAQKPDLLLVSWWQPYLAPSFGSIAHLARLGGVPVCFLCHNVQPHEPGVLDRLLLAYAYAAAQSFVVHAESDRAALARLRPQTPVHVSPHPVYADLDWPRPGREEARAALGLPADARVLLFFGFVRAYKGLGHLLESVRRLDPRAGYKLVVAGEFYEPRSRYAAGLNALEDSGQLLLLDRYIPNEELPALFAASDLVLAPYLSATGSGAVQLAYAFDRPVLASAVGGLPDVVQDGHTGYLVPPGDPAALVAAIERHFSERPDLGPGIAELRDRCSWAGMVDCIEATARELNRRSG
ncbi:MAG: glycosyltransferase [Deltaproteobacteria bacterium]|nr:glycosyltransferase [Deltaproteobacteria bacterium]